MYHLWKYVYGARKSKSKAVCVGFKFANKSLFLCQSVIVAREVHSISDLECVILKGDFSNNDDRLTQEQTLIRKFKTDTHGLNIDLDFLAPYTYFYK